MVEWVEPEAAWESASFQEDTKGSLIGYMAKIGVKMMHGPAQPVGGSVSVPW